MWRKTRSINAGSSCVGADPNRNWDAGFGGKWKPCWTVQGMEVVVQHMGKPPGCDETGLGPCIGGGGNTFLHYEFQDPSVAKLGGGFWELLL